MTPCFAAVVLLAAACDRDATEAEDRADFEDAYAGLAGQYGGDGKADVFDDLGVDVCRILDPLYADADTLLRAGLVVGAEVEVTRRNRTYAFGQDWVWDVYHHQMTVSRYFGEGLTSSGAAAGGSAGVYVGAAFNFQHSVSDWNGYFVGAGTSIGLEAELPFTSALDVEATPAVFVSAQDHDGDGRINPLDEVIFPDGVFGFQVGVSAGAAVAPTPDPLPFLEGSVSLSQGLWEPYDQGIRDAFDRLEDTDVLFLFDLEVALIDPSTGDDCLADTPDWPYRNPGEPRHDCVLAFGEPDDSHLERAVHTAASICELTGDCALPLTWPLSTAALAIGWARDHADELAERCDFAKSAP